MIQYVFPYCFSGLWHYGNTYIDGDIRENILIAHDLIGALCLLFLVINYPFQTYIKFILWANKIKLNNKYFWSKNFLAPFCLLISYSNHYRNTMKRQWHSNRDTKRSYTARISSRILLKVSLLLEWTSYCYICYITCFGWQKIDNT